MRFQLAINLERTSSSQDMSKVASHTLEMVQMADQAGFEIVWAAEHHALEMTIAPNPFQLLTWWSQNTSQIRMGCGVANAAYWHPINLAGEAAMCDLISGGRLELGLGSGAYQREFDRMRPGVDQKDGYRYLQEMLPLIRELWSGDVAHNGEFWQFPSATSVPKPIQNDVPIWVAARSPVTFDYAIEQDANIMSWPLTLGFEEAEKYASLRKEAIEKLPGSTPKKFVMMRHTAVYESSEDRRASMAAIRHNLSQFGNLMTKRGEVKNGFPELVPFDQIEGNARVDSSTLENNLVFGSSEQVTEKLKAYQSLGIDGFIYYSSMGLDHTVQKRSLETFIERVIPNFN